MPDYETEVHARACALAGEQLGRFEQIGGSGNNRLYRAAGARRRYAVKAYPEDAREAGERIAREFGGLTFLWNDGERRIAEPIACDPKLRLAVYTWLDGEPGLPSQAGDVDALAGFALALHARRDHPGAAGLPTAREAVLSGNDLSDQIEGRLARFSNLAGQPSLSPLIADIRRELLRRAPALQTHVLPLERRTLSPSDFGMHNAVRTPDGIAFVDFEYFGWDDPVKLTADVLWHPAMALGAAERQRFYHRIADGYQVDSTFAARFEQHGPLYGLRWALIVLNEFLPDMWRRRVAAGVRESDRAAVLGRQLAKAATLVERVRRGTVLA